MKKLFYIVITLMFISCNARNEYIKKEYFHTNVFITNVRTAKYSKVQGYIIYKDIKLEIDNGNSGYYYKKYKLKKGDIIKRYVAVYQSYDYTTDPYKNDIILSTSDIDITDYEIK